MADLLVRGVDEEIVRALKERAGAHGRSAEAEHREILREALLEGEEDFAARAKALRGRLRSTSKAYMMPSSILKFDGLASPWTVTPR